MPVNGVLWNLLKKVPQVSKRLEFPSTQVPQVHDYLECPSVLSTRMLESLQNAYGMPTECPKMLSQPNDFPAGTVG